MEKLKNRMSYLTNFERVLKDVELSELFMKNLREHEYFREHIQNIEGFKDDVRKKDYIFLELTKERKSCEAIIEILEESNQLEAAKQLKEYNKSPGLINILTASIETKIPVNSSRIPKGQPSGHYEMSKNPRGKFIVINNVTNLVCRETDRFAHVFGELYFEVMPFFNLKAEQMRAQLKTLSEDKSLVKDDALVVMIITHGSDERVLGYDACLELEKPEHLRNEEIIRKDVMKISDVVDIFSKDNCKQLARKPKIFIFDCCREKAVKPSIDITSLRTEIKKSIELSEKMDCQYVSEEPNETLRLEYKDADIKWVNENTHTFIIYSCSEGYWSWIIGGITAFGQCFSHAIARYACEETLHNIMCRTCTLMEQYKILEQINNRRYYSAPELRKQCAGRDLYFNVGVQKRGK